MALIHRQERSRTLLDTAWTLGLIRRALATAVLILGAPVIAAFFESADATAVIRALAFLPLLQGLRNIGVVEFQQELQFGRETLLETSGRVAETVAAVGLALWLGNVWALVLPISQLPRMAGQATLPASRSSNCIRSACGRLTCASWPWSRW